MKPTKNILTLCAIALILVIMTASQAQGDASSSWRPPNGFVPDKETAVRIAEAVWIPIFGAAKIETEKPFAASLSNNVWTVTGSLLKGQPGGVASAEISKETGCI